MSKSIGSILALGAGALVAMSLLMRQLADYEAERRRSPFAPAIELQFGARLAGPVRISERRDGDRLRLELAARAQSGLDLARLAEAMGAELWLLAQRSGPSPHAVQVLLDDDGGGAVRVFEVPRPVPLPAGDRPVLPRPRSAAKPHPRGTR